MKTEIRVDYSKDDVEAVLNSDFQRRFPCKDGYEVKVRVSYDGSAEVILRNKIEVDDDDNDDARAVPSLSVPAVTAAKV